MSSSYCVDGSSFLVKPMERHEFVINPSNDFTCGFCHRPRALHRTRETYIPSNLPPGVTPIRTQSFSTALRGGLLTDKKIEQYRKRGYYSLEFQAARKQLWEARAAKKSNFRKQQEHFDTLDGRLIYHP